MMKKYNYFAVFKPYSYLSQFTDEGLNHKTLADLVNVPKDVYPVGRLDKDSEGLLLLTNDKKLNHLLLSPEHQHWRTYWVLIEGRNPITEDSLNQLREGVEIKHKKAAYTSQTARVSRLSSGLEWLPERVPAPRIKHTAEWIQIELCEGKNRQVRHMTAAVGHPTLRLIRVAIEGLWITNWKPGELCSFSKEEIYALLKIPLKP